MVIELGDFVVCGGIIDIYFLGDVGLIWLDMFGDVLDSVCCFDVEIQCLIDKLDYLELVLMFEVILDEVVIICFCQNYCVEYGGGVYDLLYEGISVGQKIVGMEYWLLWFYEWLESLFVYLLDVLVVLDDYIDQVWDVCWYMICEQFDVWCEVLVCKGGIDSVYCFVFLVLMFLDEGEWVGWLVVYCVLWLLVLQYLLGLGVLDVGGCVGCNFVLECQVESINLFGVLVDYFRKF